MKHTNIHKFPQPFVDAVIKSSTRDDSTWDMSVTELIEPPYMRMMKRLHGDEMELDISKLIRPFIGTIGHRLLELSTDDNNVSEMRLFADIGGIKLSGQPDLFVPDREDGDGTD